MKLKHKIIKHNSTISLYPYGTENYNFRAFYCKVDGYSFIEIPEWYRATVDEAQNYIDYLKFCTAWLTKVERKYKSAQTKKAESRVE